MSRVHVICEGQTEEMFVNEILAPSFLVKEIYLYPTLIGRPGHKGGNFRFERLLTDVQTRLMSDKTSYCTTFFDFYGLPEDFPGKAEAKTQADIASKATQLIEILVKRLLENLGDEPMRRFIPYIQMYEFEGLLFSDPEGLARAINQLNLQPSFTSIRRSFPSPEDINNSPVDAPSKRITALFNAYDKPVHGSLAALEIGLDIIRLECRLFDSWLNRIETIVT